MRAERVAKDVYWKRILMVNVVFLGRPNAKSGEWALIDAGLPLSADAIEREAHERLGYQGRPSAIVLTHGHFDHVGSVRELARRWDVPVYAHERELPYLTGKRAYPTPDPTVGGGLMARLSPLYPTSPIDLGEAAKALPADGTIPGLSDWRWIGTPGHSDGHVSLFRESDGTLLAGDAIATVKQESLWEVLNQNSRVHGPPTYLTTDWEEAYRSVLTLRDLQPRITVPGHGLPIVGEADNHRFFSILSEHFDATALPERTKFFER
ncbi:MBL fold metallo-hydrolase [Paenibacillus sp. TRM 82003]|nr:MBL fold metallo-hydrolase [Paenibacillus sp. TRM 82003]